MTLAILSALLHAYVGWRIVPSLGLTAGAAFAILLVTSAVLMPLALWSRRVRPEALADRAAWAGSLAMGLFSSLFVLTVLRDLVMVGVAVVDWVRPGTLAVGDIGIASAIAVPLLGIAMTLLGLFNARRTARVVSVDIPIVDLPQALHGFTIAQISDIHVGPTIKGAYLEAIVDAVNRLGADMVAITGDLVDGSRGRSWRRTWRRSRGWTRATAPSSSPAITSTTRARPHGSSSCGGSA